MWEFVSGKVEPGETQEHARFRECQEVLAITMDVGEVFMDVTHEYPDVTVHLTLLHPTIQEGIPTMTSAGLQWMRLINTNFVRQMWRS